MSQTASQAGAAGQPVAVILAAGKSTRMKSARPKVLHEICGRPMAEWVLDAVRGAGISRIVMVVGHGADEVRRQLAAQNDVAFVLQAEQKGTGHAVMMCREHLLGHAGPVLVLYGDMPLIRAESLRSLLADLSRERAVCVIGTASTPSNAGLGRIVRDASGQFEKIVEEKDATPQEQTIREINTGCYAFDGPSLLWALDRIRPNNKQNEYYLTDCPRLLKEGGKRVVAAERFDIVQALGVNTRVQLAEIERTIQRQTQERLMLAGVTIVEPGMTYIDPRAQIGNETIIYPFTTITGPAVIGENCRIGPHAIIQGPARLADGGVIAPFQTIGPEA
jgi:bifunctional UDP-N-acetylglucosamine pyrophosphorylase / glucosamine-1-phosphate N-acetyltransferase